MTRPAGLLFDFDGVLINSLPVMQLAFSAALQDVYPDRNMPHDALFAEYRKYLGMGFPEIMNRLDLSARMFAPFRHHSRALAPYVRLYDDTVGLLDWARDKGLPLGIATGKDIERTTELLDRLGIRDYFTTVLASDTVKAPKPAPEMALRFAAENGLPASKVLLIGDAEADIACGKAAGCQTAAVTWGYTDAATLRGFAPDYMFETPADAITQISAMMAAKVTAT